MKLTLTVNYYTKWGEAIYVIGNIPQLGSNNISAAQPMRMDGTECWAISLDLPENINDFEYSYFVRNVDGTTRKEWGAPHRFVRGTAVDRALVADYWQEMPKDKPLYSSAFVDGINKRVDRTEPAQPRRDAVTLRVWAPSIASSQTLALLGETALLGEWQPEKAVRLSDANFPEWSVTIDQRALPIGAQFKFVILDKVSGQLIAWEEGENRRMPIAAKQDEATTIAGLRFVSPLAPWRGAGVAIPVFSLRSEADFGIGDFYDLKDVVDWAALTGQTFVQILPINDTTMTHKWTDSYPYNANSIFALHPMYLRLSELGRLKSKKRQKYFDDLGVKLNYLKDVDYEQVTEAKIAFFKEIFAQEGKKVIASAEFADFFARNEHWLKPYAAFCVLRDTFATPDFAMWGEYSVYNKTKVDKFIAEHTSDVEYVYYLQFNLDKQLRHVRDYAHSNGVAIKGDIPIGISRTSVDAWTDARLFYMDCQAGAPPDDFAVLGQNWGFPTYNWNEMSKDGYAWWKARFCKMSEYFDAYRIDHVLGFFRIWQIPMDAVHGLLGYFNPAMPFTPGEMLQNYGFEIKLELHTTPYVVDDMLADVCGDYAEEVKKTYLKRSSDGSYKFKAKYSTQRKVVNYFATLEKSDKNDKICEALLSLLDEVLFIEDREHKGKYHPRISAQLSHVYKSLSAGEKCCFDSLYNDFFYNRHNDFWQQKALEKLPPLIDATNMLVCAEDLGMIPACVPIVMRDLQIISLEIQRMPKALHTEFGDTWSYPYLSVCTTSTHDMSGIRQWWEDDNDAMQRFYHNVLHKTGEAPSFCEPCICDSIVDMHLKSPSMLCILPLQDYLSIDGNLRRDNPREEQINVPSNPRHYWRYRMHLTLEQLLNAHRYNVHLHEMIVNSGR